MKRPACETPNCEGYQDVVFKDQKICGKCCIEKGGLGRNTRRPMARSYPQPSNYHRRSERYPLNYED